MSKIISTHLVQVRVFFLLAVYCLYCVASFNKGSDGSNVRAAEEEAKQRETQSWHALGTSDDRTTKDYDISAMRGHAVEGILSEKQHLASQGLLTEKGKASKK
ncbi:hypothetical protein PCANC_07709 [Puccinia coronata f. sp. avenae]|uniref:Uncharacterized protein n=1 Tax=Puccinia coronata f. sp. avenae TaxID=200324 RepID=A0A2N5S3G9_9BASI|nr:hypothetical protein PCASD_21856 [Puccinia coronata f. sp. avenae]PLW14449.1 hypothetical protein PCANC_15965 [Puccinia coronata f. sp. avenae]PLW44095.1 hypothetical protein PCASD_04874 [Puccinia coronata f. sp. avenae]PLW52562.1 hypothetical protein PCANC_07709 [Puccinia coronata f. sp. avenae]